MTTTPYSADEQAQHEDASRRLWALARYGTRLTFTLGEIRRDAATPRIFHGPDADRKAARDRRHEWR